MTDDGWRVRTDRCQRAGDTWGDYLDRFAAQGDLFADPMSIREWGRTALSQDGASRRTSAVLLDYYRMAAAIRRAMPLMEASTAAALRLGAAIRATNEKFREVAFVLTAGFGGQVRVKRLRHGRERRRIRWARTAGPSPWKVAR